MKKIYVSSTFEDLKAFRRAVSDQLRKIRIDTVMMEDSVAGETRPLAKCLEDVAASDIYVGIFAWRYGYVPKENNPEARSITELEYREAGTRSKERLIFLLRDDEPWMPNQMDTHTREGDSGQQIARLRDELRMRHGVGFFSTPDELASGVSAAVANAILSGITEVHDREKKPSKTAQEQSSRRMPPDRRHRLVMPWHAYKRGLETASSIGRIEGILREGRLRPLATGFLVSGSSLHARLGDDLYLLTPAHVVVRDKTQQSFGVTVDEATVRLTISEHAEELIRLADIAWFSPVDELDISIVRLERQPAGSRGLCIADTLPRLPSSSGEQETVFGSDVSRHAFVIGHPFGGPLSFSLDGLLLDHDESALQYDTETAPGSGGSPVLDHAWRAIGVHRLRGDIPRLNGQGRRLDTCQAVSLLAVRRALNRDFG